MTIVGGLDWAMYLVAKLFSTINGWMIVDGVSVLSFSVAVILMILIIGAIMLRV